MGKASNRLSTIGVIHQNVQSISTSVEKLELFLGVTSAYQIVCLTEHFQTQDDLPIFGIKNLHLAACYCRLKGEHGGSAIYVTDSVIWKQRKDLDEMSEKFHFECSGIECMFDRFTFVVVCVYRTPKVSAEILLQKLNLLLEYLFEEGKAVVITGDLNIDYAVESKDREHLISILESFGFHMTVQDFTRVTATSNKIYDYVITNIVNNHKTKVLQSLIADHKAQHFTYTVTTSIPPVVYTRSFKNSNIENFIASIGMVDWSVMHSIISVNNKVEVFINIVNSIFNKCFPLLKRRVRSKNRCDWITPELVELRERMKLFETIAVRNAKYKAIFIYFKELYTKKLQQAKSLHFETVLKNSSNKMKCMWNLVNSVTGNFSPQKMPTHSNRNLASDFNRYFIDSIPGILSNLENRVVHHDLVHNIKINAKSMFMYPTSANEIIGVVGGFLSKNSAGFDGVSASLLKRCIGLLVGPIEDICNASFSQGVFPELLKLAVIIPVHKKGNTEEISNYRPISMLSVFSKIIEKLMQARVLNFLNNCKYFNSFQHGFTKNKSTTTALFNFITYVLDSLEAGSAVCGIFLDLSRAFDTLDHNQLLIKLECSGMRGLTLDWFASYLIGRKQKVSLTVNGIREESEIVTCRYGVPQGSVLGPLLFIIFLNDLADCVARGDNLNLTSYADDTNLVIRGTSISAVQDLATEVWEDLKDWFFINRLFLNESKSHCVVFNASHSSTVDASSRCLADGVQIPVVNSVKLLGVTVDSGCKWYEHIKELRSRLSRVCFALRTLSRVLNGDTLKTVYYANFYSLMKYGIEIWGGTHDLDDIFLLQKRAVRILFGMKYRDSCRGVFRVNDLLTTYGLYIFSCLLYFKRNRPDFVNSEFGHQHDTRHRGNLVFPKHHLSLVESGPYYAAVKFFNNLPSDIKSTVHQSCFKQRLFRYLCNVEPYTVQDFLTFKQ